MSLVLKPLMSAGWEGASATVVCVSLAPSVHARGAWLWRLRTHREAGDRLGGGRLGRDPVVATGRESAGSPRLCPITGWWKMPASTSPSPATMSHAGALHCACGPPARRDPAVVPRGGFPGTKKGACSVPHASAPARNFTGSLGVRWEPGTVLCPGGQTEAEVRWPAPGHTHSCCHAGGVEGAGGPDGGPRSRDVRAPSAASRGLPPALGHSGSSLARFPRHHPTRALVGRGPP